MSSRIDLTHVIDSFVSKYVSGAERITVIAFITQLVENYLLGRMELDQVRAEIKNIFELISEGKATDEEINKAVEKIIKVAKMMSATSYTFARRLPATPF